MKSFLIVGLGRFGCSVARKLCELGNEVLVIDRDADAVQHIAEDVTHAIVGDATDEAVLRGAGARNFDCAVVAVASDIEDSVLTTALLKEAGVPHVIAKARSSLHRLVLQRVGADEIVFPEEEMGVRLARTMSMRSFLDYVSVTDDFSIGIGDALTLLGGVFYAVHMVVVAKASRGRDAILLTILQFGTAAVCSWISAALFETTSVQAGAEAIWAVIFLGVAATGGGMLLQTIGQKYTHPATASIILSLESVFGVLFSVLFYGEKMTGKLAAGFILVFVAVIISETKLQFLRKKPKPAQEEKCNRRTETCIKHLDKP